MQYIRCSICLQKIKAYKITNHYYKKHSKIQLVKALYISKKYIIKKKKKRSAGIKITEQNFDNEKSATPVDTKSEILYIEGNLSLSYGSKELLIQPLGENDLDISISDSSMKCTKNEEIYTEKADLPFHMTVAGRRKSSPILTRSRTRLAEQKKQEKKNFCLKFNSEQNMSLNNETAAFYHCNCMMKEPEKDHNQNQIITITSDTESSSDNGNTYCTKSERRFYCDICGNGYKTKLKLANHCKIQHLFCGICQQFFGDQIKYFNHMNKHRLLVYACHFCKAEYVQKTSLLSHLDSHQEHEVLKTVLDLEENYSHYLVNLNSSYSSLYNIKNYLMQGCSINNPFNYSNVIPIVRCRFCMQEFYQHDFEDHMRIHYSHTFLPNFDYFQNRNAIHN